MPAPGKEYTAQTFVPVCASVICEAPGVIYVSIDPDVLKICCRQCQEKTEHKCALKKLKKKFKGDSGRNSSKRRVEQPAGTDGVTKRDGVTEWDGVTQYEDGMGLRGKKLSEDLEPEAPVPDDVCNCPDRPKNAPVKPYVCLCETYKSLNFMLEVQVTGEFKPAYVPKTRKGKD